MTITVGVDFRDSNAGGFANIEPTANYTRQLTIVSHDYSRSFGTTTIGWEDDNACANGRDRSAANDPRLAGIMFTTSTSTYRIDLPSTGTYSIQVALGDQAYSRANQKLEIFDNVTSKLVLSGATGAANSFIAADNSVYTHANWVTANTVDGGGTAQVNVTFASTIARFTLGDGSNFNSLAHIFITGPTGGGGDVLMSQACL